MRTRKPALGTRLLRGLATLALALVVASAGAVAALRWVAPPASMFMVLDALGMIGSGAPVRQRWAAWAQIPAHCALAVVAAEDQRFPDHDGFDFREIADALARYREGGPLRGASTISQQVAKNLFLWPGRNFLRKGLEAWFTALIEVLWPKRRILEVYLNVAEFGPGVYGIAVAGERFFGSAAAALSPAQCALLAAALPNPRALRVTAPSRYLRQRERWILRQMRQLGGTAYLDRL